MAELRTSKGPCPGTHNESQLVSTYDYTCTHTALDLSCAHLRTCVYTGGGILVYIRTVGGYSKVRSRRQDSRPPSGLTTDEAQHPLL